MASHDKLEDRARRAVQKADMRKAVATSRQMVRDSRGAMNASASSSRAGGLHPPVILQLGPHDFAVLAWVRDVDGEAVYRIVRPRITAGRIAATLARKLADEGRGT